MATKHGWTTICGECGTKGPEAETSPEAKQLAAGEGWSLGNRPGSKGPRGEDYCPACRVLHNRIRCNHKASGEACVSDSRYRLSRAEDLYTLEEVAHVLISLGVDPAPVTEKLGKRVTDSSQWWSCGKHLALFVRDMLNATPEPVELVRVS